MKKAFCVFLLLTLAAMPVYAKKTEDLLEMETEDLFDLPLEELLDVEITSAGKIAEKISEIPASVYIVTRDDIERYGYRTVAEVIRNIPGFYTIYNYGEDVAGVRGILNENNMIILINGVVQHTSELNDIMLPTEAIDRIEVVRGPMSVIYGSGAFLGSVNIVTNQIPYGEPQHMVSGSYGSDNTYKAFARTSGEQGDFSYVLNASSYGTDGLDEKYSDMMSAEEYSRLSPNAHKTTDGDLERENMNFNFSGTYKGFYADFQYNNSENGIYTGEPGFNDGSFYESEIITMQAGYRHDLTETVQVDSKVTYSFRDYEETDATYEPEVYGFGADAGTNGEEERIEAELDLIWKPMQNLNMIAGVNYKKFFNTSYDADYSVPLHSEALAIDSGWYDISDRDTWAFFMQVNYKPSDRLKLVAGARLEQYKEFGTELALMNGDGQVVHQTSRFNADEEVYFIPRIAAVWSLNDHHIFKLMYGEANKPFSPEEIDFSDFAQADLKPEEIETVELNYLMSHPKYSLSLSLFRNNIENLQAVTFNEDEEGRFIPAADNSGRMVTYGTELILAARPVDNLHLEFSTTYQDTESRTDEREIIAHSPNLLMKAKASYRWDGFTAGLTTLYVDEMEPERGGEAGPEPGMAFGRGALNGSDDYFITDLNIRYNHDRSGLFAAFKISNLFDKEVRYPATQNSDFANGLIDEGRSFLATVGWKF